MCWARHGGPERGPLRRRTSYPWHHARARMQRRSDHGRAFRRATGIAGGRGGSHHMVAPGQGFFGGYTTPGQGASIAAGLGFATRHEGRGGVAISLLGDGAARRGRVLETYAHAARLKLPVVFVVDNNAATADEAVAARSEPLLLKQAALTTFQAFKWTASTCARCGHRQRRRSRVRGPERGRRSSK